MLGVMEGCSHDIEKILRKFCYSEGGMGLGNSQKIFQTFKLIKNQKISTKNTLKLPNLFPPLLVKHPTLKRLAQFLKNILKILPFFQAILLLYLIFKLHYLRFINILINFPDKKQLRKGNYCSSRNRKSEYFMLSYKILKIQYLHLAL